MPGPEEIEDFELEEIEDFDPEEDVETPVAAEEASFGDKAASVRDYLLGLYGRATGAQALGGVDAAVRPGNPVGDVVRGVTDATGLSDLPIWGAGPVGLATAPLNPAPFLAGLTKGQTLDEYNQEQSGFREENPMMSRVAESLPTVAAEVAGSGAASRLGSAVGRVMGRVGSGAASGALGGAVDEGISASVEERAFSPEQAMSQAGTGAMVGGALSAAGEGLGAAARRVLTGIGDKAAMNRLAQAGLSSREIDNIASNYPGGIEAAARRLRETGTIPALGFDGSVDPSQLMGGAARAFDDAAAAGQNMSVDAGDVLAQVDPVLQNLRRSTTQTAETAGDFIRDRMSRFKDLPEAGLTMDDVMRERELLRKASDLRASGSETGPNIGRSEYRAALTRAMDEKLAQSGADLPELNQARLDWRLGSTVEDAAARRLRQRTGVDMPAMKDMVAGMAAGPVAGAASFGLRKGGRSIAASTGDLVNFFLRENPAALGKFAQTLGSAAARGPRALSATIHTLSQRDPDFRQTLAQVEEHRDEAERTAPQTQENEDVISE